MCPNSEMEVSTSETRECVWGEGEGGGRGGVKGKYTNKSVLWISFLQSVFQSQVSHICFIIFFPSSILPAGTFSQFCYIRSAKKLNNTINQLVFYISVFSDMCSLHTARLIYAPPPANNIYGTHMGPIRDSIWALYGYSIWGQYGFCNRDTSGTHMFWPIWVAYGSYIGLPTFIF